ncbi:translation initiation factor 2 [Streptomyces sp. JV176]|uniref:translation initiation factor 2 n=1 Tax=Streptomyces sp. JV176 TaxID=858630 RepID=UPI002E79FBFD|nr:translation initiation factor 2 [Streptomyces sp. JV176]MEE1804462.1 translation initiation factor 2 [Streptomyces sp. JV176]
MNATPADPASPADPATPAVLCGLAVNPAAPTALLLRLLEPEYAAAWSALGRERRAFPPEVAAAVVTHPEPRVRGALARNPYVDPEVRGLLVDDPHWHVRSRLASPPDRDGVARALPEWVIDRMYTTYDHQELQELVFSRQVPFSVRLAHATHPMASVRANGTGMWEHLSPERRAALLADPHPAVRRAAERRVREDDAVAMERELEGMPACHARSQILVNHRLSPAVVDSLLRDPDAGNQWTLAHNYSTPPEVLARLTGSPDAKVRLELARRPCLPRPLVDALARDADPGVRTAVSVRPELTEDERASIDYTVEAEENCGPREHHWLPPLDPAESAAYARSRHPLLRRRAAADPALPSELVRRLAGDEDAGVRVLLAQNHPGTPPELLLRCYLEYRGPHRELLAANPRFPVAGLAERFAAAEEPELRRLAVLDPGLSPALADRLSRDPAPEIRAGAARHPRLPAGRLMELLDGDEEQARSAAANPALPVAVMRRLLGGAGAAA